jgi:hypothetical protein
MEETSFFDTYSALLLYRRRGRMPFVSFKRLDGIVTLGHFVSKDGHFPFRIEMGIKDGHVTLLAVAHHGQVFRLADNQQELLLPSLPLGERLRLRLMAERAGGEITLIPLS